MGTTDNNIWLRIQQGLKETERLVGQNQHNMAMIKARQTLEYMVNCLGERALIVDGDLADSIDQLFEGRWISQAAKDRCHRIRILGNKAVHEGDNDPHDSNEVCKLLSIEVQAFANAYQNNGSQARGQRPSAARPIPISRGNASPRPVPPRNEGPRQAPPRSARPQQPSRQAPQRAGAGPERVSQRPNTPRPDSARSGQKNPPRDSARSSQYSTAQNRSRRRMKKKGFDPYDLLKPAIIFIVLLVIVLIIVKLVPGGKDKKESSVAETSMEMSPETLPATEAPTLPPEPETAAPKIYTTSSKLNVRVEPNKDSAKLGTLASGTVVEFVEKFDDEWTVVMFEGKQAYVSTQYLTVSEAQPESVGASGAAEPQTTAESQETTNAASAE